MNEIQSWINADETVMEYKSKKSYFTRSTAKLTFARLMSFILGNNRNSTQVALNDFFRNTEVEPVSKQTLFEAREKISYRAFADLSDKVVDDFYTSGEAPTYKGYTLLGVDGSTFQVPQGAYDEFGGQKSAKCDTISAQAKALLVSDVLCRIIVHSSLAPIADGERKIFLEVLKNLRKFKKALLIFDRGFYSKELVNAMNEKGVSFLFRLKMNRCQKDIDAANKPEQIVTVDGARLRIINIALPNGDIQKLATNILDENFTPSDFSDVYEKRWGVETSYLMTKERLAIENFTSAKKNLMLQDFFASIITYNLMEIACLEQEEKRNLQYTEISRKYKQSANRNIVAHEVRECFLRALAETDSKKVAVLMTKIETVIFRFFKDIRPGRTNPRKTKFPSKKFHMNKKRNL